MAIMRDRLRILAALFAAPLVGFGSGKAAAGSTTTKKKTKKKAKKKTKKKARKKVAKRKTKKKASKKVTRVSEPGTLALMGTGLVAAGAIRKLGSRRKRRSKD